MNCARDLIVSYKEHIGPSFDSSFICWLLLATDTQIFAIDTIKLRPVFRQATNKNSISSLINSQITANPRILKIVPQTCNVTSLQRDLGIYMVNVIVSSGNGIWESGIDWRVRPLFQTSA